MTRLETYVTWRIESLLVFVENEMRSFEEKGYLHKNDVTYNRARAHEIKVLCEHGIGDEKLIEASKEVYRKIVALDELE